MSLGFILLAASLTSLATMMFLWKLDIRKVLYFEAPLDLLFDVIIPLMFIGTFTGMMVAIVSGDINSITMYVLKNYFIGYKKPKLTVKKGLYWEFVPPAKKIKTT